MIWMEEITWAGMVILILLQGLLLFSVLRMEMLHRELLDMQRRVENGFALALRRLEKSKEG